MNQPSTQPEDALLSLRDISVTLRGQPILRGINLDIPRKQTLAIIGESGCGKTVTLKVMIGLLSPTRGDVLLDGKNLGKLSDRELTRERARVGFLFQNAALFDSMTVGQNIAFPLRQQGGHSEDKIRQTVYDRLREVGLPKAVVTKRPAELSGGMRKRVGLARALAVKPELMLYDEPTTGLDPVMSDVINQLMIRTRERYEVTSVVVTHDMNTVRKVADRVVMLYPLSLLEESAPQIIYDGPPSGLEQSPDKRVVQFVQGRADDRLLQLAEGA
jgi:phospholipid/cholesterol/gamma-HCH transport system ATP-binding protein